MLRPSIVKCKNYKKLLESCHKQDTSKYQNCNWIRNYYELHCGIVNKTT